MCVCEEVDNRDFKTANQLQKNNQDLQEHSQKHLSDNSEGALRKNNNHHINLLNCTDAHTTCFQPFDTLLYFQVIKINDVIGRRFTKYWDLNKLLSVSLGHIKINKILIEGFFFKMSKLWYQTLSFHKKQIYTKF